MNGWKRDKNQNQNPIYDKITRWNEMLRVEMELAITLEMRHEYVEYYRVFPLLFAALLRYSDF